jgi:hypothetical protein
MKKTKFLILLAFLTLGTLTTKAQIDVTVNPIGLLFGDLSVGADFALSDNFSVEGTLGVGTGKVEDIDFKFSNVPVNVFGKYYFNPNNGADKFYVSAFLRFVSRGYSYDGEGTTTYEEYTQTRFGLGFGLGYKVVSKGGFVFDIGFGAGRAIIDNTKVDTAGDDYSIDWPDIMFAGKLGIGYRFGGK